MEKTTTGNLTEIACAFRKARGFPNFSYRRNQNRRQDANDGDNREQLDQRETVPRADLSGGYFSARL
jgi:hypothetical protein